MIPPYLYHYTSLETLPLILQNKKLRFSRLDCLNDPLEGNHSEFSNVRKHVFVSSWTSESKEFLPMWKMYSDLRGVRLRMSVDLFCFPKDDKENLFSVKKTRSGHFHLCSTLQEILKVSLTEDHPYNQEMIEFITSSAEVIGPSRMEYVHSMEEISKDFVARSNHATSEIYEVDINSLGLNKLNSWAFEKEYRYRITFPSFKRIIAHKDLLINYNTYFKENYIDVPFNYNNSETYEILMGPLITAEETDQLKQFLVNSGLKFNLLQSTIRVRNTK